MLIEVVIAIFLFICLVVFAFVNLHNVLIIKKGKGSGKVYAEVEHPSSLMVGFAALGTFAYFLEALVYIFFVFAGLLNLLYVSPFHFQLPFAIYMQILGLALTLAGYFIFLWSVIVRGRCAVSWEMLENQKLVTWGPYRYVRHPSYLGYFLMFFGLFFLWPNLFTLIPLSAIPGYYHVTFEEEKLLVQRFGTKYLEYQKKTGRFIPKLL